MTRDEHIARHKLLHQALDELLADFLQCECAYPSARGPSDITMRELMEWSYQQTILPTSLRSSEREPKVPTCH
jgi:hypothetical protein